MTHREFIKRNFTVLAETENAIFFDAYGDKIAEVNGGTFPCKTVKEFYDYVEFFEDETFEE